MGESTDRFVRLTERRTLYPVVRIHNRCGLTTASCDIARSRKAKTTRLQATLSIRIKMEAALVWRPHGVGLM